MSRDNAEEGGGGGEVSKADVRFFQNLKIISAKSSFNCCFVRTLGGREGVCKTVRFVRSWK